MAITSVHVACPWLKPLRTPLSTGFGQDAKTHPLLAVNTVKLAPQCVQRSRQPSGVAEAGYSKGATASSQLLGPSQQAAEKPYLIGLSTMQQAVLDATPGDTIFSCCATLCPCLLHLAALMQSHCVQLQECTQAFSSALLLALVETQDYPKPCATVQCKAQKACDSLRSVTHTLA